MDRARRAEPYSNAALWTREVAKNLAGHLARMSKVQSCVDTRSPKSTKLPKFQHAHLHKRCTTSPMKTRPAVPPIAQDERAEDEQALRSDRTDQCPVSARARQEQEHARVLLGARKVKKTHKLPVQLSSKEEDHLTRVPPPPSVASSYDGCAYEQPACAPHHAARPQDFAKKQEQLKIWQENQVLRQCLRLIDSRLRDSCGPVIFCGQAMMKRLRSTKPTLNCKEWEKDDKWNQQFLKTQQKRRLSLQQELSKAQGAAHVPPLREMTATASKRPPNDKALAGTAGGQHAPSTAPAHRRIMQLRKQRSVPSESSDSQKEWSCEQPEELDAPAPLELSSSEDPLADNQLVNVRFTFSRQRQRRKGSKKSVLDVETMGLSGAFSPAIELEATLDAIAFRKLGEGDSFVVNSSNDNQTADELDQANDDEDASVEDNRMAEINAVVFEVMQDSIDRVAEAVCLQLMQEETAELSTKEQPNVHPPHLNSGMKELQGGECDESDDTNEGVDANSQATSDSADSSLEIPPPSSVEPNATTKSSSVDVDVQPAETEIRPDLQEAAAAPSPSRSEQAEEYDGEDFDDEPPTGLGNDPSATEQPAAEEEKHPAPETDIQEPTEYDEENYDEDEDDAEEDDDGVSYSVDDFQ